MLLYSLTFTFLQIKNIDFVFDISTSKNIVDKLLGFKCVNISYTCVNLWINHFIKKNHIRVRASTNLTQTRLNLTSEVLLLNCGNGSIWSPRGLLCRIRSSWAFLNALLRGELYLEFFRRLVGANIVDVSVETGGIDEAKVELLEVGSWIDRIIAEVALRITRDMLK